MSVFTLLKKNIKWRFHNSFTIAITILQPMLWLVLYSMVAKQTMKGVGIENYTSFIFAGLIILVSFSTCGSSGIMNYMMKTDGSFYRILIAPVKRTSIILGQAFEAILCSFLEISIMGIIALLFDVNLFKNITGLFIVLLLVSLTVLFMATMAYGISLILPNEMMYETLMNAIVLPIFFLSSALFPVEEISGVLKFLINVNPFTHIINSIRTIIETGTIPTNSVFFSMMLLIIMCCLSFLFAYYRLNKETDL
ncbi:TPA: ABC transporter permease [Clostridioides difficile]|nr:ABC transporter permease [Clostridioides difficile]HBH1806542.1 ABC transporter permease [Clostridioides difficile]HEK4894158.1 ABC transporter permease [Clostridioides difficile]